MRALLFEEAFSVRGEMRCVSPNAYALQYADEEKSGSGSWEGVEIRTPWSYQAFVVGVARDTVLEVGRPSCCQRSNSAITVL